MIEVKVSPTQIPAGDPSDLEVRLTNTGRGTCTKIIFSVRLPAGIIRVRGREKSEMATLGPGESATSTLRVQADSTGRYELSSANFSYRDPYGQTRREKFAVEFTVGPERGPRPEPQITVELLTAELAFGEWSVLRGRVINTGTVDISTLNITLSGQLSVERRGSYVSVARLLAGRSADVSFYVQPRQLGPQVPFHLDLAYTGEGRQHQLQATHSISVQNRDPVQHQVKILFLSASPGRRAGLEDLRVDEELREIQDVIRAGRDRDKIEISTRPAVRPADISEALLNIKPRIVHFAGHGGGADGSFVAEDDHGGAQLIPVAGLARLFQVAGQGVECVIVNACSTELLARAVSRQVPYVIGMRQPVGDRSAIRFSQGFYQGLSAGKPVEDAFVLGVIQLEMTPAGDDQMAPLLLRDGVEVQLPVL